MRRTLLAGIVTLASVGAAGCSSVPLKEGGALQSYDRLGPAKGQHPKSRAYADAIGLAGIRTVNIAPTSLTTVAASKVKTPQDRALVSNALSRSVCIGLSEKFRLVGPEEPADLTVRTTIVDIVPTNATMAGVSTAMSLGTAAVLPVGAPRLPFGLGGLAVEAEATDRGGAQMAAIMWSRGANSITNSARVSEVGDAYQLAASFGGHLSTLLVTGKEPSGLSLPSGQQVNAFFGAKPKHAACSAFGRDPGLVGVVAGRVGAPPSWTDGGRSATANSSAPGH